MTPATSKWSMWPTPSARCSPARATSARCPPASTTALWDTPASRHEAACASGSVATLAAISDLRSGAYRTALVVGVELEKTVPGDTAAQHLGAAAWTDHEGAEAKFMWPYMFDRVADEYDRRYGLDDCPSAGHRPTELRQRPLQSECADPRLDGARSALRRRSQPADRGPAAPVRLQPDDRWRRRHRAGHRRIPARPPCRQADRPHRRLGAPHSRPWPAAEARPRRQRPLCAAPCSFGRARRVRPRPRHAR